MNKVVEHAVTGGGVALLFFCVGWAWQFLGYLNRKLFITDPPASKAKAASGPSPRTAERPQETPKPQDTAASDRAIAAARLIMAQSSDRDSVSPENRQYYDFILSAAKAVLDDPQLARRVGSKMAPWG
jgi:hypothetical protein